MVEPKIAGTARPDSWVDLYAFASFWILLLLKQVASSHVDVAALVCLLALAAARLQVSGKRLTSYDIVFVCRTIALLPGTERYHVLVDILSLASFTVAIVQFGRGKGSPSKILLSQPLFVR